MEVLRPVVKTLIFFTLLILFYQYFFLDVVHKYKADLTNFAIMEKDATEGIQAPVLTFCLPYKSSVLKKYNITKRFFHSGILRIPEIYPTNIMSMNSLFMEASNVLNVDFEISVFLSNEHKVVVGNQMINGTKILVEEIPSIMVGLCYSLTIDVNISSAKTVTKLTILDSNQDKVISNQ